MYLIDTDVLSEFRKGQKANRGVREFFASVQESQTAVYLSVITVGEIRRGIEQLRHRGDAKQAAQLESWLELVIREHEERILDFAQDEAQVWGRLRAPHAENPIDKQIAATALIYDLTVVTRNTDHFAGCGLKLLNPFQ